MTDRELEAIKAIAHILKNGWKKMEVYTMRVYLRAQLIGEGFTPEETEKAITYFLQE